MPDNKSQDREERVRARAFEIWQREGGRHGSHDRHWAEASRQIDEEPVTSSLGVVPGPEGAGKPKRATRPMKVDIAVPASPSKPVAEMPAKSGRPAGRPRKI